ncbi:MAG: nicotinate-nucleotide adenylyltransferase [Candidatus Tyloplasma litorale]|nr:MAG: nicotinate-nucleotide adenylyltransferase [Mycoplasmatales bacterium]
MKIGIFGGTFNPIHKGHINVAKEVKVKSGLDVLYFVPSYKTPDKKFEIEVIEPKHRFNMVKKTLKAKNLKWLKVSNFEYSQKKVSYTYKTIEYFKNKFPNDEIFWIMGEDRYFGFDRWENYEYIVQNAKIIVYRRNQAINPEIKKDKNVIYLTDNFFNFSSTEILNNLRWDWIPLEAKKYISKNKLYLKTIVFNVLKGKRYQHSVAVASHSKRLSNYYKYLDYKKAWYAGLVHDLFKLHSNEFLKNYLKKHDEEIYNKKIPEPALHGYVCALWIRDEYLWKDKELFNAIAGHTLSTSNPGKLDKIIYLADKISTDRKGDKIGKLRKLAYKNLDETFNKVLKQSIKKLNKRKIPIHEFTIDAYRNSIDPRFMKNKYENNLKRNK